MAEALRVMAIGTVMVDLLAVGLPRIAEPGHVVYAPREIESLIGGHPIDVAIDLAKLGYPAGSIGVVAAVGEGMYGSYVRSIIDGYGFTTYLQRVDSHDTGKNLVLEVVGEDRRFHLDPGANWSLEPAHVARAMDDFAPQLLTLRPGYSGIDNHLVDLLAGLEGVLVLLDVMQPHPSRPPDLVGPALPHVAMVHCNENEAMAVTGAPTVDRAVTLLLDQGTQVVFLTAGACGASAFTHAGLVTQPGFRVNTVDATGCGDAFCAGIIEWLAAAGSPPTRATLEGLSPERLAELLAHAQAVGASAATRAGCVEGVSRPVVDGIRAAQGEQILAATRISGW